jgi:hypothetical protein
MEPEQLLSKTVWLEEPDAISPQAYTYGLHSHSIVTLEDLVTYSELISSTTSETVRHFRLVSPVSFDRELF